MSDFENEVTARVLADREVKGEHVPHCNLRCVGDLHWLEPWAPDPLRHQTDGPTDPGLAADTHADSDWTEQGRRLASQRDNLIASGVDPSELLVPAGPPLHEPADRDADS